MNKKLLSIIALILVMCFVLVGCGESAPTEEKPHEHTFESGDTWEKNAKGHWHKALCDHKDLIADFDDHNDVNDDGVCDDCGYSDPTHTHTYDDEWESDAKKHWNKSTCVHSGVIGNEAPHTPDISGVCTVCGYVVSEPTIDSVEDAVELGVSNKDLVAAGAVSSASGNEFSYSVDYTDYYEFREKYLYVSHETEWFNAEYYYTATDTGVLGVQIFSDGSVERVVAIEGNLMGPAISDGFMGYTGVDYYGAEDLIDSLYETATDEMNSNGDLVEGIVDGVYTFSFGYYANSSLYVISVAFTLDSEDYFIDSVTLASVRYGADAIEVVTEANEEEGIPATYKVKEDAVASYAYGISIKQYAEIPNPIEPDQVLMQDFVLVDGNGDLVVNNTIDIVRGEHEKITFAAYEPITANLVLNEIIFAGDYVNTYAHDELEATYYAGNDYFGLRSIAPVGTSFELSMTVNGVEYILTVNVVAAEPTSMTVGTLTESWGSYFISETDSVTITEGDIIYVAAVTDKYCDITATITPAVDGVEFTTFNVVDSMTYAAVNNLGLDLRSLPVGEYTISFTTVENASLVGEVTVTVEEKVVNPDVPTLDGAGTKEDPYLVTAEGGYVASVPGESTLYYIFTAPEDGDYTFLYDGDFYAQHSNNEQFKFQYLLDSCTPEYKNKHTYSLTAGSHVYFAVGAYYEQTQAVDVPFIVMYGSGTSEAPYEIPAAGNYDADSVNGADIYYTYTATEDVTFNLDFKYQNFYFEYGTVNFNLCTMHTDKSFSIDLTAGTTLYLKIAGSSSVGTTNIPFTVSFGDKGDEGDDDSLVTGTLVVEEVTTTLGIAGTYTYTIDAENNVTVYDADGNETDVIGFMYTDGAFVFVSSDMNVNMTVGTASFVDSTFNSVTALEGTLSLRTGPSVFVNFTFTADESGDESAEMTGDGSYYDPYTITASGNYDMVATYMGVYVTFAPANGGTIAITLNGDALIIDPNNDWAELASNGDTYTTTLSAGQKLQVQIFGVSGPTDITLGVSIDGESGGDSGDEGDGNDDENTLVIGNNSIEDSNSQLTYKAEEDGTLTLSLGTAIGGSVEIGYTVNGGTESFVYTNSSADIKLSAGDTVVVNIYSEGYATLAASWSAGSESDEPVETEDITVFDGTGDKETPYVITAGGAYLMTAVDDYPGQFITFSATETVTITIKTDVAEIYSPSFATNYATTGESYTFTLDAGESIKFAIAMYSGTSDVVLTVSYGNDEDTPAGPVDDPIKNSMAGSYEVGDYTIYMSKDFEGNYRFDVQDANWNSCAYSYTLTDNGDGSYTVVLTAESEDTFGFTTKTVVLTPNEYTGWRMSIDGTEQSGDPIMDSLEGQYHFGDYYLSFGVDWTGNYFIDATVIDPETDEYTYYSYTYTITDNNDGTVTITATAVETDGLELASKTIVATRTEFNSWRLTVDGTAQKGTAAQDSLLGTTYTGDGIESTFTKDYEDPDVYYVYTHDTDWTVTVYYVYTLTDNGDGTYTAKITEARGYDENYDLVACNDTYMLVGRTFTAVYADGKWTVELDKDDPLKNSMAGSYEVGDYTIYMSKDFEGNYRFDVQDANWNSCAYSYTLTDNGDGSYTVVLTAESEDTFGFTTKTIVLTPNEYTGWRMSIDGTEQSGDPIMDSLEGQYDFGDYYLSFGMDWTGNYYIDATVIDPATDEYTYYSYTYTITDNNDGTVTITATAVETDGLELASKTIVATRTEFNSWRLTVDGTAQKGTAAQDSLLGTTYTGDGIESTFTKDYEDSDVYYVYTHDTDWTVTVYYVYTLTDNGDGTYTVTITEARGYDENYNLVACDDTYELIGRTFTAVYANGEWTVELDEKPAETTIVITNTELFTGLSGTSYATYNGDYEYKGLSISTENVLSNVNGEKDVLQFKKKAGILTISDVNVSAITIEIVSSYSYSANPTVTIGGVEVTLPSASDINTAGVGTGVYTGNYEFKLFTITVELDEAMSGDLVIENTTNYAVYMTSISVTTVA